MVISLVNQKGGVGKTTIAINISSAISKKKRKTLLIDADPQGSVLQWQSTAENQSFAVLHHPHPLNDGAIKSLSKGFDHVVIDAPPAIGDLISSILGVSDLAVVPVGPSPLDLWSSKETLSLIQHARKRNRKLKAQLLICRRIARTRVGREAREAVQTYGLDVFETEIGQRVAYIEAMTSGLSVLDYAPHSEAAAEIAGLCEEILQ
jgi:chromosome partitioning protein